MQTTLAARTVSQPAVRARAAQWAGIVAIGLVAVSVVVPWVTVFGGLQPIPGFQLDGGYLAGIAIAALALAQVAARAGGARILRPLAIVGAVVVIVDAAYAIHRISAFVADPGPAAALIQPTVGPGAYLMILAGVVLLASAVALPARSGGLRSGLGARLVAAGALFAAGWIHLVLTPEHLTESTLLGVGFLAAGIAQLGLAGTILVRPRGWVYYAIVVVNVALVLAYADAVLFGLPFGAAVHGGGLTIGAGEPLDLPGVISKAAELVSLAFAFVLVGRADDQGAARRRRAIAA